MPWNAALEFYIELVGERRAPGEDPPLPEDGFTVIAKPRSIHSRDLQLRTEIVKNTSNLRTPIDTNSILSCAPASSEGNISSPQYLRWSTGW
jgi:hypothetical protein